MIATAEKAKRGGPKQLNLNSLGRQLIPIAFDSNERYTKTIKKSWEMSRLRMNLEQELLTIALRNV